MCDSEIAPGGARETGGGVLAQETGLAVLHALETLRPLLEELEAVVDAAHIPRQARNLIDALGMPAWVSLAGGAVLYANKAFYELYPEPGRAGHAGGEAGPLQALTVHSVITATLGGARLIWCLSVPQHSAQCTHNHGSLCPGKGGQFLQQR